MKIMQRRTHFGALFICFSECSNDSVSLRWYLTSQRHKSVRCCVIKPPRNAFICHKSCFVLQNLVHANRHDATSEDPADLHPVLLSRVVDAGVQFEPLALEVVVPGYQSFFSNQLKARA